MGMMLAGFLFLLLPTGGMTSSLNQLEHYTHSFSAEQGWNISSSDHTAHVDDHYNGRFETITEKNEDCCSYSCVLNGLNLSKNHEIMTRPVEDYRNPTLIHLSVTLYSILDVRESDQTFISFVWNEMRWMNEFMTWNESHFCGIKRITVPTDRVWMPYITIKEMTEKEKTSPSPYIIINHDGWVEFRNNQVLISTCTIQVYKFPFDTQKCKLTFKSILHSDDEIHFYANSDSETNMNLSRAAMEYPSEWHLINVTIAKGTDIDNEFNYSTMVYTFSMKRRPVLYVVSFILPILCFLCLDFASFLISDSGGEKLSFKITVLLAITVMQLILNEILPTTSDRIPLIAVYCIGVFTMMLLSLLETILVMYLLGRDSADHHHPADQDQSLCEDCVDSPGKNRVTKKWTFCICDEDEPPTEVLPDKEGSSSQMTEMSRTTEKMASDDLRKTISLFSISSRKEGRKEGRKSGYWKRVTKRINKAFLIFYITSVVLFLTLVFSLWYSAEDK